MQLFTEGVAERRHLVVISRREVHDERIRSQDAIAAHHGGVLVELAAEGGGDLDRLDAAAEGLREGAVDGALETLLEAVK